MAEIEEKTPPIISKTKVDSEAEKLKAKRQLPIKPGDRVSFSELLQWLKLLTTQEMRERITIWVYRLEPIIIRQFVDPEGDNNIDIIYNGLDTLSENYIIENHGGGTYKFVVKDEDKPKEQKGGFFSAILSIPMIEHPPKLDLREVDWENAKNKGFKQWCRTKRLIDVNNQPIPTTGKPDENKPTTNNADSVRMVELMMNFVSKMGEKEQTELKRKMGGEEALTKSMGELMLEKMKQEDPNKSVAAMVQLITAVMPKTNADSGLVAIMPMFIQMMQMQAESSKQQMTMLMGLLNRESPKGEERSHISELKDLLEVARELKGGGVAQPKGTAEVIMEGITPLLGPALSLAATIMQNKQASPIPTPGVSGGTRIEQLNQMNKQNTTDQPQPQPTAVPQSEAAQVIRQFGPLIIANLAKEGWEFAAWLTEGFPNGAMIVASVIKHGTDSILAMMKSIPEFWTQVESTYGEAHMRKWIDSFVNYKEIMAKMDAEEEEEESHELPN